MVSTFEKKLRENKNKYAENLAQYGINKNPNMKDAGDLKTAMLQVFGVNTKQAQGFKDNFNGAELEILFNQPNVKRVIEKNTSAKEYQEMYGEMKKGEIELMREVPKGERIKSNQFLMIYTPKKIFVSKYERVGKPIKEYNKGYTKWTKEETSFIRIQKLRKVPTRTIAIEYNRKFMQKQRSPSSITTKLSRTNKFKQNK